VGTRQAIEWAVAAIGRVFVQTKPNRREVRSRRVRAQRVRGDVQRFRNRGPKADPGRRQGRMSQAAAQAACHHRVFISAATRAETMRRSCATGRRLPSTACGQVPGVQGVRPAGWARRSKHRVVDGCVRVDDRGTWSAKNRGDAVVARERVVVSWSAFAGRSATLDQRMSASAKTWNRPAPRALHGDLGPRAWSDATRPG